MSNIETLKKDYISFFTDCPVQKYASMFIGRDEDTIMRWRKEDPAFAESVQRTKAEWVRKRLIATKAEFALERLEKAVFSEKSTIELEVDPYKKFVQENTIDPNAPRSKFIANEMLKVVMELTKRPAEQPRDRHVLVQPSKTLK